MQVVLCYPVEAGDVSRIEQVSRDLTVVDAGQEGIAEALLEADIFCGHAKVPVPWKDVVAQGRLKWIQSSAAGLDHCLVDEVIASEIPVTSASGLFANQVAEQTMALLFGLFRRIPLFWEASRRREFIRRPTWDLHGKTIGLVGFGGNGRRIAEFLAPLRTRLIATDWFPVNRPDGVAALWGEDQLPRLLAESDVVILSVPLNRHTHHLMNQEMFGCMREGSILINVARGPVVDEQAMVDALQAGQLAAAGLDVTEIEPLPPESPLWEMDQVLITPHVGAQSARRVPDTTDFFCDNLTRFLGNQPLMNLVDKKLGFPSPEHRAIPGWRPRHRDSEGAF